MFKQYKMLKHIYFTSWIHSKNLLFVIDNIKLNLASLSYFRQIAKF